MAIAIGTAHGIYPKNVDPKLRLDILEETAKRVDIPLVLHGGSSIQTRSLFVQLKWGFAR